MQMAVLLDDHEKANALLDGKNSTASKFGAIRYYNDRDIPEWSSSLRLVDVHPPHTRDFSRELGGRAFYLHALNSYGII